MVEGSSQISERRSGDQFVAGWINNEATKERKEGASVAGGGNRQPTAGPIGASFGLAAGGEWVVGCGLAWF
jgi:hypothetical protein